MYNTNWQEKYNRKAQKEMTYTEAYDMMEWEHNLLEDMAINRDRRRKHRKPFTMSLTDVARIVDYWQGRRPTPSKIQGVDFI